MFLCFYLTDKIRDKFFKNIRKFIVWRKKIILRISVKILLKYENHQRETYVTYAIRLVKYAKKKNSKKCPFLLLILLLLIFFY